VQQRIAHELVEGHHHRHRIAGQAEEERVADAAEGHRPAGRMAIFQNSTSPSFAISSRVKSASPTDTPPVVMTTSLDAKPCEMPAREAWVVAHHAEVVQLDARGARACRAACSGWSRRPRPP
jgi:hypothetical protein